MCYPAHMTQSELATYIEICAAQEEISTWADQVSRISTVKNKLSLFFNEPDAIKLSKRDTIIDLTNSGFSILRTSNMEGKTLYRLLTHNKIGSGGFGDVKLAFPILFSEDFNSIVIQLELPMVAKRYIQKDTERNHRFPIPSPQALQLLQEGYPDQYSAAKRDLTDPAGFYKKYITMPLFNGQNLFDYLTQNEGSFSDKPISQEDVLKILMGLAIQIGKLHKRGIIHRDIKPENIIIGRNLSVYLIDFDFCAPNQDRVPYSGTKDYTDPDIMAAVGAGNSFERVSAQRDLFPFVKIIGFFIERCHPTLKPFLDGLSKHIDANLYKTTMSDIETSLGSIIQAFYRTEIRIPQQPQKQFELKEQWIRLNLGRKIYML